MIGGWGLHKRPASPAGGWASQPWSSKQSVELMSWWKLWCPNGVFFVPGPSEDPKTVNVVNVLKCLGQKKHTHTNYIHMYVYIYNIVYNNYIYTRIHTLGGSRHDETWWRRLSNLPLQSNVHCSIFFVKVYIWLVVSTLLKNISQLGWLFPTYGKRKKCSKQPTKYGNVW
jgi:hypothetical protein